jgi:hypothetical protein
MVDVEYARGWDDCLDAVLTILQRVKDLKEAANKVEGLQVLVKSKKFEKVRLELGVVDELF